MLRTPEAVRERCAEMLSIGERGELRHFVVHPERLHQTAELVVDTIRGNYPDLVIPYHSRWRHFSVGGVDRWSALAARLKQTSRHEMARIQLDLIITSVLLDAGSGPDWFYRDPTSGERHARSEGLALASLAMFEHGAFSSRPESPCRVDATALRVLDTGTLGRAFQVTQANPLAGVEGRCQLLRAVGEAIASHPSVFGGDDPRLGRLYDHFVGQATDARLPARKILLTLLDVFSSIWPGRCSIEDSSLGDVWHHDAIRRDDVTDRLVPFHKLTQWLAYSLIEPLEQAGITVTGLGDLTGLAEYRNGGLFIDLGVIRCRDRAALERAHPVESELVVEWRALTVALLDRLAPIVRATLGLDDKLLPLAKILEGGTWSAGRRVARTRREDGSPPLRIVSDGTVF